MRTHIGTNIGLNIPTAELPIAPPANVLVDADGANVKDSTATYIEVAT